VGAHVRSAYPVFGRRFRLCSLFSVATAISVAVPISLPGATLLESRGRSASGIYRELAPGSEHAGFAIICKIDSCIGRDLDTVIQLQYRIQLPIQHIQSPKSQFHNHISTIHFILTKEGDLYGRSTMVRRKNAWNMLPVCAVMMPPVIAKEELPSLASPDMD